MKCICLDPETHVATLFANEGERAEWLERTYPQHLAEYHDLRANTPSHHDVHRLTFTEFMAAHHSDFLYLVPVAPAEWTHTHTGTVQTSTGSLTVDVCLFDGQYFTKEDWGVEAIASTLVGLSFPESYAQIGDSPTWSVVPV